MRAGLARFLWLWLLPLVVFIGGLARAFLTGQVDPWDWGLPAALLLAVAGLMLARRGTALLAWVAMGGAGTAIIFCAIAAARAPDWGAALGLIAVALLAVFGAALLRPSPSASRLRSKRTGVAMFLLILAALLLWRGPAQPLQTAPDRPKLAIITGLPLFWSESGQAAQRDAPIVTVLRSRFTVMPIDDPSHLAQSGARRLLLAQPRALTPAQLIAIDQWVRAGGAALVLADPLLRWPSDLPLGDRRRAPSISLLGPLLYHWGFSPLGAVQPSEIRHVMPDGRLLTLSGMQLYRASGDRSIGPDDEPISRKRIGRGAVVLLGDADPIDDRLWLGDPARPLDPRAWVADTPARVVHWLGGTSIPGDRRWMRQGDDVATALRWALLSGLLWAIVGAVLLRGRARVARTGTKSEYPLRNGRENG